MQETIATSSLYQKLVFYITILYVVKILYDAQLKLVYIAFYTNMFKSYYAVLLSWYAQKNYEIKAIIDYIVLYLYYAQKIHRVEVIIGHTVLQSC